MRFARALIPVMLCLLGMPALPACDDQDVRPPAPSIVTDEPGPLAPSFPDSEDDLPDDPAWAPESEPDTTDDCAYVGDYTCETGEGPYGPDGPGDCAFPGDVKCTVTVPGPLLPEW